MGQKLAVTIFSPYPEAGVGASSPDDTSSTAPGASTQQVLAGSPRRATGGSSPGLTLVCAGLSLLLLLDSGAGYW